MDAQERERHVVVAVVQFAVADLLQHQQLRRGPPRDVGGVVVGVPVAQQARVPDVVPRSRVRRSRPGSPVSDTLVPRMSVRTSFGVFTELRSWLAARVQSVCRHVAPKRWIVLSTLRDESSNRRSDR